MKQVINRRCDGLVQQASIFSILLLCAVSFETAQSASSHATQPTSQTQSQNATSRIKSIGSNQLTSAESRRLANMDTIVDPPFPTHKTPAVASSPSVCIPRPGFGPGESVVFPSHSNWSLLYRDKEGELGFTLPMSEGAWGTGDWFGLRHKLVDTGVSITGDYTNNILANVVGGKKRGFSYADQINFRIDLDMQKLIGWKGLHVVASALNRNGTNVSQQYTGNIFNPNQIYGSETIQLYNLYLEQTLFDGWLQIKAGRIGSTEDFSYSPLYGLYVNNGIDGQPAALVASGYLTAWPSATWGARLRVNDKKDNLYAMAGIYQTSTRLFRPKYHGVDFGIRRTDGIVFVGEVGWTPEFQPHSKPISSTIAEKSNQETATTLSEDEEWHGMPGHYKFGGFYTHWTNIPTFDKSNADGTYGFYWLFDQMVYQAKPGSECGLTLWGAFILVPDQRTAKIPYEFSAGTIYTGLIPGRRKDQTSLAVLYGTLSNVYAAAEQAAGQGRPTHEIVLEASYTIRLNKFFRVQPDVQYIIRPGGTGQIPNALVIGAQIGFNF